MKPGEKAVRLFDPLSVRPVRGAGRRPLDRRMTRARRRSRPRRQRERARLMAWLLGAFVVLLFLITIAKIGLISDRARPAQHAHRR